MNHSDATSRRKKSRAVILARFLAGDHRQPDFRSKLISRHHELLPELEEELTKLEKIRGAVRTASQGEVDRSDETKLGQPFAETHDQAENFGREFMLADPRMNSTVTVPNYELIRCVGKGGFGEVWLAKHVVTQDFHAVKVLGDQCLLEIEAVRRYMEQLESLEGLVEIKEIGKSSSGFYYVMPLADDVKGATAIRSNDRYEPKTLAWCHRNLPPMSISDVVELGVRLLTILENLHAAGLTHCDVKPANIISIDSQWMLSDIGLMTRTDQFPMQRGTAHFLPPEGRCDHSADLYAIGKTLFLLATGAGLDRYEDYEQGLFSLSPTDSAAAQLRKVIVRGCHAEPGLRYQAAREMRQDLQKVLADGSASAVTDSSNPSKRVESIERVPNRRIVLGMAASLCLLLMLVAGGIALRPFFVPGKAVVEKQVAFGLGHQSKMPLMFRASSHKVVAEEIDGKVRFKTSIEPTEIKRITCLSQAHRFSGLAVGGEKGVCILDSETGERLGGVETTEPVKTICWSQQHNQMIICQGSTAEFWHIERTTRGLEFEQAHSVALPFSAEMLSWSDRMNLLVAANKEGVLCMVPLAQIEGRSDPSMQVHHLDQTLKSIAWHPDLSALAIGLERKIRLVWLDDTRAEELEVAHEFFLHTQVGSQLIWLRGDLLNVASDVIERWTFAEDREYLKDPHLEDRIELERAAFPR